MVKSRTKGAPTYGKQAIITSKMFTPVERDILKLSLDENKTYTLDEVNKIIADFKGGI